ncbi:esterase/lipase family protein [Subtercola vilae]|uniref:esterase/lipase family protein n=1 Tax=Subtercola vilae TaxID=2056433 RepID=UPI001F434B14|nr:alpha/beta hydrolase [Subtercola vilae]
MTAVLQKAWWWALDYGYAVGWQMRAVVSRVDASTYASGSLRPVVVIPGIYENWQFMRPLVEELHAAGHPVHVVAMLERNDRPLAEAALAVCVYLEGAGLEHVVIVAHSKGGLIGKTVMLDPVAGRRIDSMIAVSSPFSGSRYARFLPMRALRAFSVRDAGLLRLSAERDVNARITSVYASFDPHIPGGSQLPGATNIRVATGGHFRVLADPDARRAVLDGAR